jgi:hypothetical protein
MPWDRAPVVVLALDPGSRARRIVNDLDVAIAAIKRELNCEITLNPRRRRRHGGKFRLSWLRVTITMRIDVGLFNGARLLSARLPGDEQRLGLTRFHTI